MENIWLVVPTFNERANILELITRLMALKLSHELNVLVVDDASPDGTATQVKNIIQVNPRVHLLERTSKQGLGSAYRAGFAYAKAHGATVVGEMDADLSHSPEEFPRLVAALDMSAEVVIGSRRVKGGEIIGWNRWRRFTSLAATYASRIVLHLSTLDVTAGYRLYRISALNQIPWSNITSNGYAWQEEILYLLERQRAKIVEVPITFIDRKQGKSKLGARDIIEFFKTLWRLKREGGI